MHSVLLDTSFCIRLLNAEDELHENALEYYKYFLDKKIDMYLSTIVIAEYTVKDDATNLPLKTLKIIPFEFRDAVLSGKFFGILTDKKNEVQGINRLVIKDDCKLIAQLINRNIDAYITKDRKSFNSIINPILNSEKVSKEIIDLSIPIKDYLGTLF